MKIRADREQNISAKNDKITEKKVYWVHWVQLNIQNCFRQFLI